MHDIDCINDHDLYSPSMVNHERVVPNLNDHKNMIPLCKCFYNYMILLI